MSPEPADPECSFGRPKQWLENGELEFHGQLQLSFLA